jgi:hypothetical protein
MAFVLLYAASFYYAYIEDLNPVWEYFGFKLSPLNPTRFYFGLSLLCITALFQNSRITAPSTLIVFILYANVYIPCLITTLLLTDDSIQRYGSVLVCLSVVFICSGIATAKTGNQVDAGTLSEKLDIFIVASWILAGIILAISYYPVMNIVPLDDQTDVYGQRMAGFADSFFLAYTQTFFSNIFNPTILLIGLIRKRLLLIIVAFIGGAMMYAITAQRTALLLPLLLLLIFLLMQSRRLAGIAAFVLLAFLSVAIFLSTILHENNLFAAVLALLLTFRTIAIPGLTISQYEDLFSEIGHTYWAHVKIIDIFVSPPHFANNDPLWPNLGYIVGDRIYNNSIFNVNANLFAGDGIAAFGSMGVLAIGAVLIVWLKLIEKVAIGWNSTFATVALLPPAISLTNGHFFTTMLSFGGIFWLLAFKYAPRRASYLGESAGHSQVQTSSKR